MFGEAVAIDESVIDEQITTSESGFDAEGVDVRCSVFTGMDVLERSEEIGGHRGGGEEDNGDEDLVQWFHDARFLTQQNRVSRIKCKKIALANLLRDGISDFRRGAENTACCPDISG